MSANGGRGWLDPALYWRPVPVYYVKYEAYEVWHYFGTTADPRVVEPEGGISGYAAEIKFSLDSARPVVVRFLWSDGTLSLEEFARSGEKSGPRRELVTDVPSAAAAQEVVMTILQDEAFWKKQFYRFWWTEGRGGRGDGPSDGGPEP